MSKLKVHDQVRIKEGSMSTYGFPPGAALTGVVEKVEGKVAVVLKDDAIICKALLEDLEKI